MIGRFALMHLQLTTAIFCVAILLAVVFVMGGAGLYGSPFGGGGAGGELAIFAAAILVGPLASAFAFFSQRKSSARAGAVMILGAAVGTVLGLVLKTDFQEFWGFVFAGAVWLPMLLLGIKLCLHRGGAPEPRRKTKSRHLKRNRRG